MLTKIEKALRYARLHGWRQFIREVRRRLTGKIHEATPAVVRDLLVQRRLRHKIHEESAIDVRDFLMQRRLNCAPLQMFAVPRADSARVSLVTDSVNRGSLYGGVGTGIIMAALLAEARGARLRIITREPAIAAGLHELLELYGIAVSHDIEFACASAGSNSSEMDVFDEELFITTSWWTTAATLAAVDSRSIVYLLQEDERMFYAHGDNHLLCSQVLANRDIRFVINTRLLYDHLVGSGLSNIAARGVWFEPSFPHQVFHPVRREPGAKRKLAFYARGNAERNLFYFGVELVDAAITRGIIDLEQWDVMLLGRHIPELRFDDGRFSPQRHENVSWSAYAELAGQTDLALCLMYTPHPSYPPFDFAASGSVVVTNRFGNKQDLSGYSANILCGDLNLESMLETLERGLALALDLPRRNGNFESQRLGVDWTHSFAPVIAYLDGAP
jgi:O-antigen biosynthesis protein